MNTRFDLIFDAVGKIKKSRRKKLLASGGKYVSVKETTKPRKTDLQFVKELIESSRLITVIDRTYDLETIQEAHRYVEQFRKRGNVAVKVR